MALKKMTLTMRVEAPIDESMLDIAGFRSMWEEIDGLADSARSFGELTHFSVEDLPDRIVLADTRPDSTAELVRALVREEGVDALRDNLMKGGDA
jgi:hypothetical protein